MVTHWPRYAAVKRYAMDNARPRFCRGARHPRSQDRALVLSHAASHQRSPCLDLAHPTFGADAARGCRPPQFAGYSGLIASDLRALRRERTRIGSLEFATDTGQAQPLSGAFGLLAGVGQDQQSGAGDRGGDVFGVCALDRLVVVANRIGARCRCTRCVVQCNQPILRPVAGNGRPPMATDGAGFARRLLSPTRQTRGLYKGGSTS